MQLTKNQKLAIESTEKPTAIIASAGSGKTEVLTQRLKVILNSGKVGLNQILAITFTEKAAQELKRRIASGLSDSKKQELAFANVGTFHGFCLNLLKEQAPLLHFSDNPSVWDEHTAKLAIHRHCREQLLKALDAKEPNALFLVEELEFRHALLLLEELLQFRWHAEKHIGTRDYGPKTMDQEGRLLEATRNLYKKILESYTEEKSRRQTLDFQDLEILALNLLTTNEEVLKNYQNRFAHILVDEVQDINDLQRELIRLLFNPSKNCLCVVGDPKQSIYRFRGANVEGFKIIVDWIVKAGGHLVELNENFRSRPEILQFVNHTFQQLFSPVEKTALVATRERRKDPALEILAISADLKTSKEERRKTEALLIAQTIQKSCSQGKKSFGDFALLFQSLSDVRHYEKAFKAFGIPYHLSGGRGFLNAQEVIDLLFCLKLMVNLEERLALVGLMRSPLIGFTDGFITQFCLKHPTDLGKALLEQPEANWLKELFENRKSLSGAEILSEAVSNTHYDLLLHKLDPSGTKLANVEQFIELTRKLEIEEEMSLEDLLEYFEELKKRRSTLAPASTVDQSSNACQLMTVHAAKGLEFPIIILPDLLRQPPQSGNRHIFLREEGLGFYLRESPNPFSNYVPSETTAQLKEKDKYQDLQERKRLLYVALTRAKEKLLIPWHEEGKQTGPWYGWLKEALGSFGKIPSWDEKKLVGPASRLGPSPQKGPLGPLRGCHPLIFNHSKKEIPYVAVTKLGTFEKADQIGGVGDGFGIIPKPAGPTQPLLQGTQLGNIVHGVLKQIGSTKNIGVDTLLKKNLFEQNVIVNDDEFASVRNFIHSFLKSDMAPPTWEGLHELPFRLKISDTVVTGIIDYAFETPQGWVICDFKTDTHFEPEKYQRQMDCYALALSKGVQKPASEQSEFEGEAPTALPLEGATRAPIIETRLLFLKTLRQHSEKRTNESLKASKERLEKIIYDQQVSQKI
ncbi:MAG: hypothetical protein A3F82_00535 [Deltaproteobacteria bacterium RIFCSPLOWO2_12_FULL_44_12]|nr:MAG: hypothetical protein A2712_04420 [Deltaproteobacteria bacterium RIFCSPHIGHO2_01_FULL_43_49]OGQ16428.1 MAG: hypothetical protein A3D22_02385 [Deltaproteobacteria bacterium RIFCSPHIGHO2_02_FULL_44_53]OGQ27744.1 MAG: hypothetical protein A3D98_08600 [Deltaproteobacteria bacterium RIFCSPHIGHO2_12_FULL_44_21]OGQ32946.1 MAG: hypothetical protein A2979_10315 [Deltaproteobacteria bacterium RIFCSPLOWO2_01_FULL_45_74]OGQ42048.1 MAG: hypothetical protein A3I70_10105 [Deltaproteobacteria bacterium 